MNDSNNEVDKIHYTIGWKGNKCHPFNSRQGRLKGPKNIYIMGSKLDSFLRKRCFLFCFVHVVLRISLEIMRKKITSVGLSYKDVILFSKLFYVFGVVYVKSNGISCKFSDMKVVATL